MRDEPSRTVGHDDEAALAGVRAALVDIDGVVHVAGTPVEGAADAIDQLRAAGIVLRFLTNTTSRSRAGVLDALRSSGVEADEDELLTPATLALAHCREHGHHRAALLVSDDLRPELASDLEVVPVDGDEEVDVVVLGDLGDGFTYAVLNAAFRRLMAGAELIALQKNRFWQTADGLSLDVGPFAAALEYATGREATVVGKPSPAFFRIPLEEVGVDPDAAVMIGDDVESDIGGALAADVRAVLVRTGKYRREVVAASGVTPTAVVDSMASVPALLGLDGGSGA